jgi:probable F420-dependent oxidoreductase
MRIGLSGQLHQGAVNERPPSWALIRWAAREAEAAGLDSYWVYDHLLFRDEAGTTSGIHEAWTMLTAIAASTERIAIGSLILCASFRNPALLAKMATTLDEVSGGRLVLGLGVGWNRAEFDAFGYPFEDRIPRFRESVALVRRLLDGELVDFTGSIGRFAGAELAPPPLRRIPILVASWNDRLHDVTALYADRWNSAWHGFPADEFRGRLAGVRAACKRAGRDPATLEITAGVSVRFPDLLERADVDTGKGSGAALSGSADVIAAGLAAYSELGVDEVIVSLEPFREASVARLLEAVLVART